MKFHQSTSIYSILVVLGLAVVAAADTTVWTNSAGGLYTNVNNWSGGVPDSTDDFALFQRGAFITYTVTFPGNSIFELPVHYINGTLSVGSNNVTFVQPTSPIIVPPTFTNTSFVIGGPPSEPAVLNTSLLNFNTGSAIIGLGAGSPGLVNINGGNLNITGSNPAVTDLIVGNFGGGTINVLNGAKLNIKGGAGNATVGGSAGVNGSVTVSGAGSIWNNESDSSSPLMIGQFGLGNLDITNGGQVNDHDGFVALEAGSTGIVTLSGAGSKWTNRGRSIVGLRGTGLLSITNGAQVSDDESSLGTVDNAIGTVTVSAAGSKWQQAHDLNVGIGGNFIGSTSGKGFVNIVSGGEVSTGGDAFVGDNKESAVTIEGNGSKWTVAGTININELGTMNVRTGGFAASPIVLNRGAINVSGANSILNVSDFLEVSTFTAFSTTSGTLNVTSAAHVNSRLAFVGSDQLGQATVDGAGSTWATAEQLFIGLQGKGDLFITNAGQVTSDSGQLGVASGSRGSAKVSGAGSEWATAGDLTVGVAGTGNLSVLSGGNVVVGGLLSVGPRGTVQGNSTVTAFVRNGGTMAPGIVPNVLPNDSLGTLHIDGGYTQTGVGALDIELGSTSSFDKLSINGHVTLDGKLKLSLLNGFMPAVGNTFQVLTATNGITGTMALEFTSLQHGTGGPGWMVVYSNSDVVLKWVNFPTGDFNNNGTVDAADYAVWRDNLGQSVTLPNDSTPGTVTAADYDVWRSHFGQTAGSGAGASANVSVPEPATWLLIIMAVAGVPTRRYWCVGRVSKLTNA